MASTSVFERAMHDLVDPFEGGLSMRRSDPGNWTGGRVGEGELKGTNMGVSAATYPDEDIVNMTRDRQRFLFKRDFWDKARCPDLPGPVAYYHFDAGLQHGVQDGVGNIGCEELLQRALRPVYAGREDGILGPNSMRAVAALDPFVILARYQGERQIYYAKDLRHMFTEYGRGWSIRQATAGIYASRIEANA